MLPLREDEAWGNQITNDAQIHRQGVEFLGNKRQKK